MVEAASTRVGVATGLGELAILAVLLAASPPYSVVGRGEECPLRDPGSELRKRGSWRNRANIALVHGMGEKTISERRNTCTEGFRSHSRPNRPGRSTCRELGSCPRCGIGKRPLRGRQLPGSRCHRQPLQRGREWGDAW